MRILLVSTTAIGDTLMATPFLRAVRNRFPDAHIAFMVHHIRKEVVELNPSINELIVYYGKGKHLLSTFWKLRRGKFDKVIVLHANDPDIVPLVRCTGAPMRAGWGESKWANLFTHTILRKNPPEHFMLHKKRLLESIGIPVDDLRTELVVDEKDDAGYRQLQKWLHTNSYQKGYVVMHPFGSNSGKWWPLQNFFEVAEYLRTIRGQPTIFVGDAAAGRLVERHPRFNPSHHYSASNARIRESAVIIRHADRMLTTDSGPMHLAFAVQCPTMCLFGPTSPAVHGPCFDKDKHVVIHRNPLTTLESLGVIQAWGRWHGRESRRG
jgi:ADP-heptose:LPS heptosyltransferase